MREVDHYVDCITLVCLAVNFRPKKVKLPMLNHIRLALAAVLLTSIIPLVKAAHAAELDGVSIPETMNAGGKLLYLNGYGVRTYSILGIHVYVAALYLQHPNRNPEDIIRSPEVKLLNIKFERNIDAEKAREAWRDGLAKNCQSPCRLEPEDVEHFLSGVPAMHAGQTWSLMFMTERAVVEVDGHELATIPKRQFAEAMLATFLGPNPGTAKLKKDLLGGS